MLPNVQARVKKNNIFSIMKNGGLKFSVVEFEVVRFLPQQNDKAAFDCISSYLIQF